VRSLGELSPGLVSAERARVHRGTGGIASFGSEHLPAVAALFQNTFRPDGTTHPASLEGYLRELFLEDSWAEPDLSSRVYIGTDGAVIGFIGALPTRMAISGEPVRALTASTLMVANPGENPTVGARLLRSFLSGPQDLSLADTASPLVRAMWRRLGGMAADAFGQDWWVVLQPASFAAAILDRKRRLSPILDYLAPALNGLIAKITPIAAVPEPPANGLRFENIEADELAEHSSELALGYSLRPAWDAPALRKRLRHASFRSDGTRLFMRAAYRGHELVGCCLYRLRRGGVARTLDLIARPGTHKLVLRDLLAHATAGGR
jgi:hypothetical protein